VADKASRRTGNQVSGVVTLLGYFLLFCSSILFAAAASRSWKAHQVALHWRPSVASIQDCSLGVDHPFADDGGGTIYYLRCHLSYQFEGISHDAVLNTTSARSLSVRDDIDAWSTNHRSGSALAILVSPTAPKEFAVAEQLPVAQWPTARDGLYTAIPFAILGAVLVPVGLRMGRRRLSPKGEITSSSGTLLN
jgi:hypothetical protein